MSDDHFNALQHTLSNTLLNTATHCNRFRVWGLGNALQYSAKHAIIQNPNTLLQCVLQCAAMCYNVLPSDAVYCQVSAVKALVGNPS